MKLDRTGQRALLERLSKSYPGFDDGVLTDLRTPGGPYDAHIWTGNESNQREAIFDLAYLREHGLVSYSEKEAYNQTQTPLSGIRITAKGLDFLAEDGGLGAILGVVTVRLHDETIKILVEGKLAQSQLPETEKATLIARVRGLGGTGMRRLVDKLCEAGIDKAAEHLPDIIESIGKVF